MPRPTILTLLPHYLPGFKAGGPVRSVANLVEHLGDAFQFRVLTSDRDLGDEKPFDGIEADRWVPQGKALVHYTSPDRLTLRGVARILRQTPHDLLYLNSVFAAHSTIAPLVARRLGLTPERPLLIAPRGEFSPGALALKRRKKDAYIRVARFGGLFRSATWHASSDFEASDIEKSTRTPAKRIMVARNLPSAHPDAATLHKSRSSGGALRVIFVSRISRKKNLDFALKVLGDVSAPVVFNIFGPPEDAAYAAECVNLSRALPPHIKAQWCGAILPNEISVAMAEHDLFFLPTLGENYGHVIAESLAVGTPVLISDTTPWRGLAELGIGDDLPLADSTAFVDAIERAATLSPKASLARRERASAYARERHRSVADIEANVRLFAMALTADNASNGR